jgi:hypothetical protein
MRARTKLCALTFTGMTLFASAGCGVSGSPNPSSTPAPAAAIHNQWTWIGGANVADQPGVYGTLGTPSSTNAPGAREQAVSWTDASGNFWLFGGDGYDSTPLLPNPFGGTGTVVEVGNYLNDLWKYSAGQWTWMGGSNLADQPGIYGILGTAATSNIPGPRDGAVSWVDASGSMWLFGGRIYTVIGSITYLSTATHLNDLWKYSAGEWTWMGGSSVGEQSGTYGTQGTAAPGNIPGGRFHAVSWTDSSGNLWLFGGDALDPNGTKSYHNDLWKYSAGQWTWMGGSSTGLQPGIYGTQGTANAANVPGGREQSFSWTDASGNFWLFGGDGYDSQGNLGFLNDLWKYSAGQWTWVAGSNLINQPGTYGTQGTAAPGNIPGARNSGVSSTDASGNLWLFGGGGHSSGVEASHFNDLWKYSAGQWTWVAGSSAVDQTGTYGTQGTPAAGNVPGWRYDAASWIDTSGALWLFGGNTPDPNATLNAERLQHYRNDVWKYQP